MHTKYKRACQGIVRNANSEGDFVKACNGKKSSYSKEYECSSYTSLYFHINKIVCGAMEKKEYFSKVKAHAPHSRWGKNCTGNAHRLVENATH